MIAIIFLYAIALFSLYLGHWLIALIIIVPLSIVKIYQLFHFGEYYENLGIYKMALHNQKMHEESAKIVWLSHSYYRKIYPDDPEYHDV